MKSERREYLPGDRVRVIDSSGGIRSHCAEGDILHIKKKMNGTKDTYYVEELRCCIAGRRFKFICSRDVAELAEHIRGEKEEPVEYDCNGWPNRETDEAALVFFNDRNRMDYVKDYLVDRKHISVNQAAVMIWNTDLSYGDRNNICVHSILRQYAIDRLDNTEISSDRYHAIVSDLEREFGPIKQSPRPINNQITPEEEIEMSETTTPKKFEVETKHLINGADASKMDLNAQVELIRITEARIDELKAIKTTTKVITAEIIKLETFLKEIVALFDKE